MSLRKQAVSGVKWNALTTSVITLVQFLTLAVLARLLSPDDFGLMGMAVVVTGLASTLADFGLSNAIIFRQDATREQLSSIYWFSILISWLLWALIWVAAPLVALFFQQHTVVPILRSASLTFLILPLGQQFQAMLRRELRFAKIALIRIAEIAAYGATAIFLAWKGHGVMSLVWATVVRTAVATLLFLVVGMQQRWLPGFHFQVRELRGIIQFGLFQMGERILNYLGNNVDYVIIGRFLGAEALGYYTLAYNLMRVPQTTINPIVVSVAFPAFARVQNENDKLRAGYSRIISYLSTVTMPLMLGMLVVAPLFIPIVYGKEWLPAVAVVQIFSLLGIAKSLGNPISSVLLAKGRADLGFYMNAVAIIGYTLSNVIGVRWGIAGVAWSSLAFTLIVLVPVDFYLRWLTIGMRVREFWEAMRASTLAVLALVVVTGAMSELAPARVNQILLLATLITVGAVTYLAVLWRIDRDFIAAVWRDIRNRRSQAEKRGEH